MPMPGSTMPRYPSPSKLQNYTCPYNHNRICLLPQQRSHHNHYRKKLKYDLLLQALVDNGWHTSPLIVIIVAYRGGVRAHNLETLSETLHLSYTTSTTCLKLHRTTIISFIEHLKPITIENTIIRVVASLMIDY